MDVFGVPIGLVHKQEGPGSGKLGQQGFKFLLFEQFLMDVFESLKPKTQFKQFIEALVQNSDHIHNVTLFVKVVTDFH